MHQASAGTVLREWGRLGWIGFGGPPTHIALLRDLCVTRRGWIGERDFEDAVAACNLLPGPASTQMAIYCAWRVRGRLGAVVGGLGFVVPGLLVDARARRDLPRRPPARLRSCGAAAGARGGGRRRRGPRRDAASCPASYGRTRRRRARALGRLPRCSGRSRPRRSGRGSCSCSSPAARPRSSWRRAAAARARATARPAHAWPLLARGRRGATGGLGALAWVALKVGALSYGGGFVIIPLMQGDAVDRYGWMTDTQFADAVALGPGHAGPGRSTP